MIRTLIPFSRRIGRRRRIEFIGDCRSYLRAKRRGEALMRKYVNARDYTTARRLMQDIMINHLIETRMMMRIAR